MSWNFMYLECGVDRYTRPIVKKPAIPEAPHEVPLMSTPPELERALAHLEATVIVPQSKICTAITAPAIQEAPLEKITSPLPSVASEVQNAPASNQTMSLEHPLVTDKSALVVFSAFSDYCPIVGDDSKHLSHFSVPIPEPSVVPEAQYVMLSNQVMCLVNLLITDDSALVAFFACSDYRLPVKHPCITSPIRQIDHVSGDSEVPTACYIVPEAAPLEAFNALPELDEEDKDLTGRRRHRRADDEEPNAPASRPIIRPLTSPSTPSAFLAP
ncbi:hypothetical protein BDR03DRAFT_1017910 [Suillus americanus]|nr:hypothetical protein BDR03DRAFT_1017910 [Suillus americanus]